MEKGLLYGLLHSFAQADESAAAFSLWNGEELREVSYRDYLKDVLRAAGYFRAQEIRHQHIVLAAANSYEWLVIFLAVLASGNVAVLLNPALPDETLAEQSRLADASFLWCDREIQTALARIEYSDMAAAQPMDIGDAARHGRDETVVLLGTSGTTGQSKIVEITSGNLQGSLDSTACTAAVPDMERVLLSMPLYHIGGAVIATLMLRRRKTLCIGRGMKYLLADMPVLNPTYVPLVPAAVETLERIMKRVTDAEQRKKLIGTGLKRVYVGGAAPKVSSCQYFASQGLVIETGYGMTETCGDGTWCELNESNIGTIGRLRGQMQCRIENGELLFKSASVMKGYYKDPEETAKVIVDGWLHTGDMGRVDENGYYFVTGRKKNVIILSNGENVNPEEIEAALGRCEAILECMVYSNGKGICADVYTENEAEARRFIRQYNDGQPLYRQVYKVECAAQPLEKTSTGKIRRKENQ